MYKYLFFLLPFIFSACGGGNSSSSTNNSSTTELIAPSNIKGKVIDGELIYASVFLDLNKNLLLDANEPTTKTDEKGEYALVIDTQSKEDVNYKNKTAPLVSIGGFDKKSKKEFIGILTAPFSEENPNITPITTLITKVLKDDVTKSLEGVKENLALTLGIKADDLMKDPVKLAQNGDSKLMELSFKIHQSSELLAKCLKRDNETINVYEFMAKTFNNGNKLSVDELLTQTLTQNSQSFNPSMLEVAEVGVKELSKNIKGIFEHYKDNFSTDNTIITKIALNLNKTQNEIINAVNKNEITLLEKLTWESNKVENIKEEIVKQLLFMVGYKNEEEIKDIAKFNTIDDNLTLESLKNLLSKDGNYQHIIDVINEKLKDLKEEKGKNSKNVLLSKDLNNFTVTQVRTADWDSGFCENITVKNISSQQLQWSIKLKPEGTINNLWNAIYTQDVITNELSAKGVSWNSSLKPNQIASFGYCATKKIDKTTDESTSSDSSKLIVTKKRESDWNSGFCEKVVVSNPENKKIVNWEVSFDINGRVNNLWSASYEQRDDLRLFVSGKSWNKDIKANGSIDFGYCATKIKEVTDPDKISVLNDKKALTFEKIKENNLNESEIISNLKLITKGSNGSSISWESNKVYINPNGEVSRPKTANINVELLAIITKGKFRETKRFNLKVLKVDDEVNNMPTDKELVALAKEALTFDTIKNKNTIATDIKTNLTLLTQGSSGTSISWSSSNTTAISITGIVSHSTNDISVVLTASISKGTVVENKSFTLIVKGIVDTSNGNDTDSTDTNSTKRFVVGYLPTWLIPAFHEADFASSKIAMIDELYTHVVISFVKPNLSFNGTDFTGTGIEFSSALPAVKKAIESLQARGVKVLLAVGGASYNEWDGLIAEQGQALDNTTYKKALKAVMDNLNLDGLDVDYEVTGADANNVNKYYKAILALKEVTGNNKLLTLAAWSTGADCTAKTSNESQCSGKLSYWGNSAGRERLTFSKLEVNGYKVEELLNYIAIMTYDGGREHFDPITLFKNYQEIYKGQLAMGFEIPYESWGGAELVASNAEALNCESTSMLQGDSYLFEGEKKAYSVERLVNYVNTVPYAGVMLWSLYEDKKTTCPTAVNYTSFTSAIKTYLKDNNDNNSGEDNSTTGNPTDLELVSIAKTALTFNSIKNTNVIETEIKNNLSLITLGAEGVSIRWASSSPAITAQGVVTQNNNSVEVTLTATLSKGSVSETKKFNLVVLKEEVNAGVCQVIYSVRDPWDTGFVVDFAVVNQQGNVYGWDVTFTLPKSQRITDLWNGNKSATTGFIKVTNKSYNAQVNKGAKAEFGFVVNHSGQEGIPTDIRFNGKLCDGQIGGVEKPAKPTAFKADLINNSKVTLSWSDNSNNEDNFLVYQSVDLGAWKLLALLDANQTSYENIAVEIGHSYEFKVEAKNIAGTATSSTITVTPLIIPIQTGVDNKAVALVSNCMSCHQKSTSDPSIPIIHGLGRDYLAKTLKGYRTSDAKNSHYSFVMHRIMDGYNDDEMEVMMDYFSAQSWIGNSIINYDVETIQKGETLFQNNCIACHGTDGKKNKIMLSGQSEQYLVDTMTNYAKGLHKDAHDGMKFVFENNIGDDSAKIEALAKYLAVGLKVPTGDNNTIRGLQAKYLSSNNSVALSWEYINPEALRVEVMVNGVVVKTLNDVSLKSIELLNDGTDSFVINNSYALSIKVITANSETLSSVIDLKIKTNESYGQEYYSRNCKVCHGVNGTARADLTQWDATQQTFSSFTQNSAMDASYYSNCDSECLELIGVYVQNVLIPRAKENNDSNGTVDVNSDIVRGYRLLNRVEYTNTLHTLFQIDADASRAETLALHYTELPKDNIVEGYNTDRNLNRIDEDKIKAFNNMASRVEAYLDGLKGQNSNVCLINGYDFCVADKNEFLNSFATKIFRRPLSLAEKNRYAKLESVAKIVGDMLVSPKFLYRSEMGMPTEKAGVYALNQYEIATAISYAMAGTTPDDELLNLAKEGTLSNPNTRVTQAVRLGALPTGKDKLDDFIGRWLLEDNIYSLSDKNPERFNGYSDEVRTAQSTQILKQFRMVMESSSNSAYKDLFINDFVMSNRVLSDYYGENMSTSESFEKVPATSKRYGLLTLGAIASKYANSEESHPFKRGKFVLARLMCHPLGLPGNGGDVPAIRDHTGENKRDRYAEHVNDPSCATCHNLMDPIGFTWENYDGSGRYRTSEYHSEADGGPKVIDTSVTLKGLLTFNPSETYPAEGIYDVSELIANSDRGPECMALQYYRYISGDTHAHIENSLVVKKIVSDFKDEEYDLQSLFTNMVKFKSFITRKGE